MPFSRIASLAAASLLALGGAAVAAAQTGSPPEDPPSDAPAASEAEFGIDTATAAQQQGEGEGQPEDGPEVEDQGPDDTEHDNAEAFSEWVESLELEGCQRGQTIAKVARQGPTSFGEDTDTEPVPVEDLPGRCAEGDDEDIEAEGAEDAEDANEDANEDEDEGEGEPRGRPADKEMPDASQHGQDTADEARSGAQGQGAAARRGGGPPSGSEDPEGS